jgi:hypothetical protein
VLFALIDVQGDSAFTLWPERYIQKPEVTKLVMPNEIEIDSYEYCFIWGK